MDFGLSNGYARSNSTSVYGDTAMTVTAALNKIIYSADGSTTAWSFPFPGVSTTSIQVFITDSSGNITQLATTAYTVILNPPISPNPTGIGGTVNYPLTGPPLAIGNQLTIIRELSVSQSVSLSNQSIVYPPVVEAEFDYLTMLDQQDLEIISRTLTVGISDPPPLSLPPVAQRRNQNAFFDTNGNLVPGLAPGGSVFVSPAMQPVVGASTLPLARTAMGLGSIATENIGSGLQDDGAGNLRTNVPLRTVTTNQTPTAALHGSTDIVKANVSYTLGAAATYFNGFGFYVDAFSGIATLIPHAGETIGTLSAGVNWAIPVGSYVFVQTDGVSAWYLRYFKAPPPTFATLSGSGTYVIKPGCTYVRGRMVAAGGTGAPNSTSGGVAGVTGGNTAFGGWGAVGGGGASAPGAGGIAGGAPGSGGTGGANGTGTLVARFPGGPGEYGGSTPTVGTGTYTRAGAGGGSFFGGGAAGGAYASLASPAGPYGSGGAGGPNGAADAGCGGGGGAGEYAEFIMPTLGVTSIAWFTGAAGVGNGIIFIEDRYDGGP